MNYKIRFFTFRDIYVFTGTESKDYKNTLQLTKKERVKKY